MMTFNWMLLAPLVNLILSTVSGTQNTCCVGNDSTGGALATLQVQMEKLQSLIPVMHVKIKNLEQQVALMSGGRLPGTCEDALINGSRYRVEDRQLSASSVSENSSPSRSRLHTQKGPGQMYGAWRPIKQSYQWIEVDFERQMQVTAIGTQGADQLRQWVKTYYLRYGDDGVLWKSYVRDDGRSVQYYDGNTDSHTVLKHRITFRARFVRLMPRSYQSYPALRWEIYGCPA